MKKMELLLVALISFGCFGPQEVEMSELTKFNGRMYLDINDAPFTGFAIRFYDSNKNQKACKLSYENGKMHGKTTCWYKSGEKMAEAYYRLGEKRDVIQWNKRGDLNLKITYTTDLRATMEKFWENGQIKYYAEMNHNQILQATVKEFDENGIRFDTNDIRFK